MFAVVTVIIAFSLQAAHAEAVPDHLKSMIRSWVLGHGTGGQFAQALSEMSKLGIINVAQSQNVWKIPSYGDAELVRLSGRTPNVGQTSPVTLTVTDPGGRSLRYTVPVLSSGVYSTVVPLGHDSPAGTYLVSAIHANTRLPSTTFQAVHSTDMPSWMTRAAGWWLEGRITDREFLSSVEFLVDRGVLQVSGHVVDQDGIQVSVGGHKAVRRGTAQDVSVYVTDVRGPVDGAVVFVRVEDYSSTVLHEFEGRTDSDGTYGVSWRMTHDIPNLKTFLVYIDVTDGFSSATKMFSFQVYCLCGEPNCMCRP